MQTTFVAIGASIIVMDLTQPVNEYESYIEYEFNTASRGVRL